MGGAWRAMQQHRVVFRAHACQRGVLCCWGCLCVTLLHRAFDALACTEHTSAHPELPATVPHRDYMMATRGITEPEMIIAVSAHAAFIKAAGAAPPCACCGCSSWCCMQRSSGALLLPSLSRLPLLTPSLPFLSNTLFPHAPPSRQSTSVSAWSACRWALTSASLPRRWLAPLGPAQCW